MAESGDNEVLIEYVRVGAIVRVTAIDPVTGTEVVFQAPASLHPSELRQTAVNKLKYVLKKTSPHT
jgi:hypothetical protein